MKHVAVTITLRQIPQIVLRITSTVLPFSKGPNAKINQQQHEESSKAWVTWKGK